MYLWKYKIAALVVMKIVVDALAAAVASESGNL